MIRGRSQESRRRARRSEEESPERCAQRKSGEERKEAQAQEHRKEGSSGQRIDAVRKPQLSPHWKVADDGRWGNVSGGHFRLPPIRQQL